MIYQWYTAYWEIMAEISHYAVVYSAITRTASWSVLFFIVLRLKCQKNYGRM